jgi:hypothetical protein
MPPCEDLTETGCKFKDRNVVCAIYPFVIFDDHRRPNHRRILLDTGCPHWKLFIDQRDKLTDDYPASIGIERSDL